MKKRMMLLLAMILTVLTLAACGGSKISPVVGNWKATTVSVSGVSVDVDEYLKQSGNEDVKMEMVLEKDNTMSINMAGQTGEGTWKLDGSTLTLTIDGDSLDTTYEDGKITMDLSGVSMTLEKQ
ncbi:MULTISPECIES: lipocalin-like domain-containing protein [unclassified Candidatus Paralachnospira]|uniref:lipocalin-like domain-containing protein n=1 Tax=unclassified Candidatus Paralachnospira TaxID=3099471 RepID=UPI00304F86DD